MRARAFFVVATFALGCSSPSESTTTDSGAPVEATITCEKDPRADTYFANLERMGTGKLFKFVLVQADPAPPSRGINNWTLKILDAAGKPVTDATIEVKPFMPDHGHPSSVKATVTKTADAYTITNIYFFMPGLWQVTFTAQSGTTTDSVVYTFCVAG